MRKAGLRPDDVFDAPSFGVNLDKSSAERQRLDCFCVRLGEILDIKMS